MNIHEEGPKAIQNGATHPSPNEKNTRLRELAALLESLLPEVLAQGAFVAGEVVPYA